MISLIRAVGDVDLSLLWFRSPGHRFCLDRLVRGVDRSWVVGRCGRAVVHMNDAAVFISAAEAIDDDTNDDQDDEQEDDTSSRAT